ncbi:MAG: transaldolase [Bryobacteraceae bacterium]|nr:transaldolase [Bryobacteraceae bacterium]
MSDPISALRVKIFADGADKRRILELAANPVIAGFTTNPTLMKQAGVTDYEAFARDVLTAIPDRPFSFEVFSDDFDEMYVQACTIASWGDNVYVKIPVTNTRGDSAASLARQLTRDGVKVNFTALLTLSQVERGVDALSGGAPSCISVFAGRIADAGVDPLPIMRSAMTLMAAEPQMELIWASPREVLNILQADEIGCHIITVTHDLLKKLTVVGKDLTEYSLDTVRMFYRDASEAGFQLRPSPKFQPVTAEAAA